MSRVVFVPTSKVGYLIGYGGRTIKGFERRSGCHISIVDPKSRRKETRVRIQGPHDHIGRVVRMLMDLYGCNTLSSSLFFPTSESTRSLVATERRMMSNEFIDNYLIVRRGFRVRELETQARVKVAIFRDDDFAPLAPVDVTGDVEGLERAWMILEEKLDEFRKLTKLTNFMDSVGLLDHSLDILHNDNTRAKVWTLDKVEELQATESSSTPSDLHNLSETQLQCVD